MAKGFITREAGAVLSRKNSKALRIAFDTIAAVLKTAGIDLNVTEDDPPEEDDTTTKKPAKEAAGFSVADTGTLLQNALNDTREAPANGEYQPPLRIVDIFEDQAYFVYCVGWSGSEYYRIDYTMTDDGIVTLSTPMLVNRKVTYIAPLVTDINATESGPLDTILEGAFIRLNESAVAPDGSARIRLITPGVGSSGYYSPDVLRQYGPAAFPKGCKMYIDHDTVTEEAQRPEGTLTRFAAVLTADAAYVDDPKYGPGLYAPIEVKKSHRTFIDDVAKDIGTSIRADGRARMGEVGGVRMPIITEIKPYNGLNNRVDFVTAPGAGGRILALFESARKRIDVTNIEGATMTPEEIAAVVRETLKGELQPLQTEIARLHEASSLREAQTHVTTVLATPKYRMLPAATRDRIAPQIAATVKLTEAGAIDFAALDTAIETAAQEEARYLSSVTGRTIGLGESAPANAQGGNNDDAAFTNELTGIFGNWGLSEAAAKTAANGRQ